MYPILIASSDHHSVLWSNQALLAIALVLGCALGPLWMQRLEGIDARRARRALLLLVLATLFGGRLHFILNQWPLFQANPWSMLAIWRGGLHAGGAVIALMLALPLVMRHLELPIGKFADGLIPTAGLCLFMARVGCFLHGCCFGTLCNLPWCVSFPHDSQAYSLHGKMHLIGPQALESLAVHPLQLYFAGVGLALTGMALWMHRRKAFDGEIALVAALMFAGSSTVLEFLRADQEGRIYWGPFPQLAWIAAGLTLATALLLAYAQRSHSQAGRASGVCRTV